MTAYARRQRNNENLHASDAGYMPSPLEQDYGWDGVRKAEEIATNIDEISEARSETEQDADTLAWFAGKPTPDHVTRARIYLARIVVRRVLHGAPHHVQTECRAYVEARVAEAMGVDETELSQPTAARFTPVAAVGFSQFDCEAA